MSKLSPLWQEISDSLSWHMPKKDKTALHRFNRLTKEHFPKIEIWLDQYSCNARDQPLCRERLEQLIPWHKRQNPQKLGGKIIVFVHEGEEAIVDGNNRVAHYLASDHEHSLDAIVVELRAWK